MSIRFEVSEIVRASPEQVLDAMLDLDTAQHWMPGLVRMERLSSGPLEVGSELAWFGKLLVLPYKKACSKDLTALKGYLERAE